ncbi:IMPG1 [Branchiostoma lanceolatum]|nr:IMPG1 [Branchiostoma lanceolatum]
MAGINATRKHNATQAPPSPTMVMTMTAGPGVNRTRIMPTGHTITMAVNTTLPPHKANATAAVTHPPTTNYNTKPATTVGSFPACNTTCHRYATCVAGNSGKSCVCNAGYSGDGTTCTLASKKVNLEMRMTSIPFTEDLKDKNSEAFRSLSFKVSRQIFVYLRTTSLGSSLLSVTILNFRQGSVVANYNANFKSNATVSDSGVSSALQQAISKDPNNTLGIDVASLCTKTNEDAACGETTGMDQNLLIGLAVGVPVAAIILLIILGWVIKRARDGKKDEGEKEKEKADSKDGQKDENNKNEKKTVSKDSKENKNLKKDVNLENGKSQRKSSSSSYGMQEGSFEPPRNYKRMTFQPAVKAGPADKYEHDLGGIYFPKRYHMPQEPKPSFHYVEGHVQGKPVTVVVPI